MNQTGPTEAESMRQRLYGPLAGVLPWFGLWTLIGLAFAFQLYVTSAKLGQPVSWGRAVSWSLGDWYVYAVLSLGVTPMCLRYRLASDRWRSTAPAHLVASVTFSLLYMMVRALIGQAQARWGGQVIGYREAFEPLLAKTFLFNALVYWVIVISVHALAYYRESVERQRQAAELEHRLAEARLKALQMQLNPHFLFNTLHSISALMHRDVELADRMVSRLSELLRYALESTDDQEVELRRELEFLDRYLEIERVRFGDRLSVLISVDGSCMDMKVPNLVLQPLVENAIRHGIAPHARRGVLEIGGHVEGGRLILEVTDNGGGLMETRTGRRGIGLENTRARLRALYGEEQGLELENRSEGGTRVRVTIPVRRGAR